MQVFTDDGTSIDVRVDGPLTADTVVLLHGFPFTHDLWSAQIEQLAQTRRVIRPDLRCMGSSSVQEGPYLMEVLAADVAAILDHLGIDRATIVGHSLGGYVALAFARMFTERITHLALVCSRLSADTPEQAEARRALADRLEREGTIEPLADNAILRYFAARTPTEHPEIVECTRAIVRQNNPRGAAAMLRGMALRSPSVDIAPDLDVPVVVVAGAQDAFVPLAEYQETARAFRYGKLVACNQSGHLPMLEEPQAVTAALAALR